MFTVEAQEGLGCLLCVWRRYKAVEWERHGRKDGKKDFRCIWFSSM